MAPLARVLTVDPTGVVARLTRAALDLLEAPVVQVDVPGDMDALDELEHARFRLVVLAQQLGASVSGAALARRIRQGQPEGAIVVLADEGEGWYEPETRDDAAFVLLQRPLEGGQFLRIVQAALEERDYLTAAFAPLPPVAKAPAMDAGFIPAVDIKVAERIVATLLNDVGAIAGVMSSRAGDVLLQHGATSAIDRHMLTAALLPSVTTTIEMGRLVGGRSSALQMYDGGAYTVYVLSVGLHHFVSLIFPASSGARALGAVTRYGRRATEDLVALIGANALLIEAPPENKPRKKRTTITVPAAALEAIELPLEPSAVRGAGWGEDAPPEPPPPPEPPLLQPIAELDETIFQQDAASVVDPASFDDLFDPERLAEIASETRQARGPLSYDEARELGLIP
jgi:hypothetical protein